MNLNEAMKCDELQLRWVENYLKGTKTTLEEDLILLFEHSTDEQIFMKYTAMTNVNEANIEDCIKSVDTFSKLRDRDNQ